MSYRDILRAQLKIDEGVRTHAYRDTVGKLTIGCGRNLDDIGVNAGEIELMLDNDITRAEAGAYRLVPGFEGLSNARKAVVVNLVFNMGERTFGTFTNTLAAINSGRWDDAADGMAASKWASQVGPRATRLIAAMRQG